MLGRVVYSGTGAVETDHCWSTITARGADLFSAAATASREPLNAGGIRCGMQFPACVSSSFTSGLGDFLSGTSEHSF